MKNQNMIWVRGFWGAILVPENTSDAMATTLTYLAFKGEINVDAFLKSGEKALDAFAKKNPMLLKRIVHEIYPVDSFCWIGEYCRHWDTDERGAPDREISVADNSCEYDALRA
jgi:hypothetical protein